MFMEDSSMLTHVILLLFIDLIATRKNGKSCQLQRINSLPLRQEGHVHLFPMKVVYGYLVGLMGLQLSMTCGILI
jgi:hypothetical protein